MLKDNFNILLERRTNFCLIYKLTEATILTFLEHLTPREDPVANALKPVTRKPNYAQTFVPLLICG